MHQRRRGRKRGGGGRAGHLSHMYESEMGAACIHTYRIALVNAAGGTRQYQPAHHRQPAFKSSRVNFHACTLQSNHLESAKGFVNKGRKDHKVICREPRPHDVRRVTSGSLVNLSLGRGQALHRNTRYPKRSDISRGSICQQCGVFLGVLS